MTSFGTRLAGAVLWRLSRFGVHIEPFLVVREAAGALAPLPERPQWRAGWLDATAIPELVALEPGTDAATLARWFAEGRLCWGVRAQGRLVAKMWCDLAEFSYPPSRRRLGPHEAYLYNAYADPAERGHGLAPWMRQGAYVALRERGRTACYSYTRFFNEPARRFKAKLGAADEALRVHVHLGHGAGVALTLRRYAARPAMPAVPDTAPQAGTGV